MAKLTILTEENEFLRKTSRKVDEITPRIITLLDDMYETMKHANGVGLAAVQVGVLRRVVVIEVEEGQKIELINPEIVEVSGSQNPVEGCLSVPGKWAIKDRPMKATIKAINRHGKEFKITGEGLLAQALCHELEHLEGKLFIDDVVRMVDESEL